MFTDLDIRRFPVSEEMLNILEVEGVSDIREILLVFEKYKFLTRDVIIQTIKCQYPEINLENVNPQDVRREIQFSKFEEEYNVIIHAVDGKNIVVYSPLFENIAEERFSLDLPFHNIEHHKVTDINFMELQGMVTTGGYNPNILFKRFLLEAVALHATDLHFTVEHHDLKVRYPVKYRKDGVLYEMKLFELNQQLNKELIMNFIEQKTSSVSLDVALSSGVTTSASDIFNNGNVELRISAHRVKDGYRCVIRIQEKKTVSMKIADLGFPVAVQRDLLRLSHKRSGFTLITGAIRTGKNTTACAMANEMVTAPISMISYDSPIEILMKFAQVDYRDDPQELLNYVRLAKKQDIDVAYINEIPTKDVAFAIRDLVNSSVYVLTTMHLDRIWHLPYRLKEYYGDNYKDMITQINGVINQKMFSVLCPNCRKQTLISSAKCDEHYEFLKNHNVSKIYTSVGCHLCKDEVTGSSGTVIGKNQPIVEHLIFTDEIKDELLKCTEAFEMESVLKKYVKENKQSLEDYMLKAIETGVISSDALEQII